MSNSHGPFEILQALEVRDVSLRSKARGYNEELCFGGPAIGGVDCPFAFFLLSKVSTELQQTLNLVFHLRQIEHQ